MADFNFEITGQKDYANETIRMIKITRNNDAPISRADIIRINDDIEERFADRQVDTLITIETSLNSFFTIKGYRREIEFDDDYFEGRVRNVDKFSYATTVYFHVKLRNI